MKKFIYAVSAASLMLFISPALNAQKKKVQKMEQKQEGKLELSTERPMEASPQKMEMDMMMKKWEAYMTPGEFHKWLEKNNGIWMQEVTMWMDPSAPPTQSTAQAENTMILGGRYQQSVTKGEFNGMPFEGISTVGYDNSKKAFVATWLDNMGTGIVYMEGKYDEVNKAINFKGKMMDCMSDKEMTVREVFKVIDDNTQVMEWYEVRDGKERKTMEIKMKRKV